MTIIVKTKLKAIAKKLLVLIIILTTIAEVAHAGVSSTRYIKQEQARNYIEHVVQSLFMPSLHTYSYVQELDIFVKNITERLLVQEAIIGKKTGISYYKALVLCEKLLPAVLDFICEKSKVYAQQELLVYKKHLTEAQNNQIQNSIAQKIRNQASHIIYYADPFPAGALMKYIGAPLRTKVATLVKGQCDTYK